MIDLIGPFADTVVHFDRTILVFFQQGGIIPWLLLFFAFIPETGFILVPYLPGDTLLFITGAFAAYGGLNIWFIAAVILAAVCIGDTFHFLLGRLVGIGLFERGIPFLKKEYYDRTHAFYERYGGWSLIIARFFPLFRTFVPFLAGIGAMSYRRFFLFSITGAVLWIGAFLFGGYVLGTMPAVRDNFLLLTVAVIIVSLIGVLVLARSVARGGLA